ncbi:MAG TPA: rhomboid family intramembrane serine protease [Pseudidiomarina sp.]|nr:rhomboid family intramembrane serine protease [Pseudidiomarina sp.]
MTDKNQVIITSIVLAVVSLWLFGMSVEQPTFVQSLWYERDKAVAEIWRLVTTHALHLSWQHVIWNSLALVFVTLLFAQHFTVRTYINGVLIITVLSSLLIYVYGNPTSFAGWSILVHGWLLFGLLIEWQRAQWSYCDYLIIIPIVLLFLKVGLEGLGWALLEVAPAQELARVHAAGLIAALPAFLLHRRALRQFTKKDASAN